MEVNGQAEKGMGPPGILAVKIQPFKPPSKNSVFNWDLPWVSTSGLETGVDMIIALYVANAYKFNMHPTQEGCRSWSKEILALLIKLGVTNLLGACPILKLNKIAPEKLSGENEVDKIKDESLKRLDKICKYWFTTEGKPYERELNSGEFIEGLPTPEQLLSKIKQWKREQKAAK